MSGLVMIQQAMEMSNGGGSSSEVQQQQVVEKIEDQQQQQQGDDVKIETTATTASPSEPDVDAIKMFVGQIPRNWNETDCRKLFEAYGPVYSCNILRDKSTQTSKGCCFVTFYHRKDAIEAQGALHNIRIIDGMHHPVQMKPADSENRNERKLFIGQLSKKHTEDELKQIFAKYGQIEDCSVLRDQDGKSRGCAFVTFANRSCAVVATKEMHHSQTMEGCAAPLVVKFADTQKDKDVKQKSGFLTTGTSAPSPKSAALLGNLNPALIQQLGGGGGQNVQAVANLLSLIGGGGGQQGGVVGQQQNVLGLLGSAHLLPQAQATTQLDALTQVHMAQMAQQNQLLALQGYGFQQHQHQQNQAAAQAAYLANLQQQAYSTGSPDSAANTDSSEDAATDQRLMGGGSGGGFPMSMMAAAAHHRRLIQQQQQQLITSPFGYSTLGGALAGAKTTSPVAATLPPHQALALSQFPGAAAAMDPYQAAALQQQYALLAGMQTAAAATTPTANGGGGAIVGNGDVKGPDGANLFIYHLPQDFGDADLLNTFSPFGPVLSAKVFIDKVTNLSKCFGFVSFDNPTSAANAISAMHGFQIGSKRLKVQLKDRGGKPYNR